MGLWLISEVMDIKRASNKAPHQKTYSKPDPCYSFYRGGSRFPHKINTSPWCALVTANESLFQHGGVLPVQGSLLPKYLGLLAYCCFCVGDLHSIPDTG